MATTQTQIREIWGSTIRQRRSSRSSCPPPPEYELSKLAVTRSVYGQTPPEYEEAIGSGAAASSSGWHLRPLKSFQIEAAGQPLIALPFSIRPVPIPVYAVDTSGHTGHLAYKSLRTARYLGNSKLVRAGESEDPVCRTTYRFGPGRPPCMHLHGLPGGEGEYEVVNKNALITRTQIMRTHLGTFEWRYAGRSECEAEAADCLLVFEQVRKIMLAGGGSEDCKRKVAQFVRNPEVRTAGSTASTGGNGGRLMMDLTGWTESKREAEQMEVLIIASCIVMLKKELDRRRAHQIIMSMSAEDRGGQ